MRLLAIAVAAFAALAVPASAGAWSATPTLLSCGEADFTVTLEKSPWNYSISEDGKVVKTGSFIATQRNVSIGVRASSDAPHSITVTLTNGEARSSISALFIDCGPVVGPAGPPGKDGTNGLNGKDGTNGKDGKDASSTSVIERVGKLPSCTSNRVYKFVVRKRYHGRVLSGPIKAADRGAKISVSRNAKGRYVVTADYRGLKVGAFTSQRHIFVSAVVAGRGRLAFNENVDLCRPSNGRQNAPSASGDAKG